MAWDGNGNFNRKAGDASGVNTWNDLDVDGFRIRSDHHDEHDQDIADGLNNCLLKDGTNSPNADLPMGGQKFTNVANATSTSQYVAIGQVQDGALWWGDDSTGSANTYTVTITSPDIEQYFAGMFITFKAHQNNTGACVVNVNSLGNRTIRTPGNSDPASGDIVSGRVVVLSYSPNNQYFVLMNSATGG